jgi:hypothetical protein
VQKINNEKSVRVERILRVGEPRIAAVKAHPLQGMDD